MATKKDESKPKLSVGDTVGIWTVVGEMGKEGKVNVFPCRCACGTERAVAAISLWNGNSQSCGCDKQNADLRPTKDPKISAHLQPIFDLISEGRLPPADGLAVQGDGPTWTLKSMAKVIGITENQLIQHLNRSPPRFADELKLS